MLSSNNDDKDPDKLYEDIRYKLSDLKTAMLIGHYDESIKKEKCIEYLDELESLSKTYGFDVLEKCPCPLRKIESATFLGKGKIEELIQKRNENEADVVIFDDEITPNQQRNLEKLFKRPVIDRTELILEVFAQRAQTKEAQLQIELAKTKYQLPRLKRLWTHLSRQAGSAGGGASGAGGYLKGEGERQIEIDRRILKKRISSLKEQLDAVTSQRKTQRQSRLKSGIPLFGIIGYTNAGKSTLLNALTQAGVLVEDKLFATLDTTTRKFKLPNGQEILLIDTVGFIRKIPHGLVESFKSTLEESVYTDILLHVVDISNSAAEEQAQSTIQVLKELRAENKPTITILNKVDKCKDKSLILKFKLNFPKTVMISALNQEGFDKLYEAMISELKLLRKIVKLRIPQSHYALISTLMNQGRVIHSEYIENDVLLEVEIPKQLDKKVLPFMVE